MVQCVVGERKGKSRWKWNYKCNYNGGNAMGVERMECMGSELEVGCYKCNL